MLNRALWAVGQRRDLVFTSVLAPSLRDGGWDVEVGGNCGLTYSSPKHYYSSFNHHLCGYGGGVNGGWSALIHPPIFSSAQRPEKKAFKHPGRTWRVKAKCCVLRAGKKMSWYTVGWRPLVSFSSIHILWRAENVRIITLKRETETSSRTQYQRCFLQQDYLFVWRINRKQMRGSI